MPDLAANPQRVWKAADYWKLAGELFPAAQRGDTDAQYYLWYVLDRCNDENRFYFIRPDKRRSLDEALDWARSRGFRADVVTAAYGRCHEFLTHPNAPFGTAADWLAKATAAGQAAAQSTTASKLLKRDQLLNIAGPLANLPEERLASRQTADELLAAAIQSRDPTVLWNVGEMQALLNPTDEGAGIKQFAWWLVACRRGFDCDTNARWIVNGCYIDPACPGGTGEEVIRYWADQDLATVEQLAIAISDKLDAGDWSGLGFAP